MHYALLIVLALMWLMPVLFVILTAFKTDAELTLRQFSLAAVQLELR